MPSVDSDLSTVAESGGDGGGAAFMPAADIIVGTTSEFAAIIASVPLNMANYGATAYVAIDESMWYFNGSDFVPFGSGSGTSEEPYAALFVTEGHAGTTADPFFWTSEYTTTDVNGVYFPNPTSDRDIIFQNGIYVCTINFVGIENVELQAATEVDYLVNVPDQRRSKQMKIIPQNPGLGQTVDHNGATVTIDARVAAGVTRSLRLYPGNGSQTELPQIELAIHRIAGTGDPAYNYVAPPGTTTGGSVSPPEGGN